MIGIKVGDMVKSLRGRDKGEYFLVVKAENNAVYVVDGKIRKVNSPKKKNVKHLQKVLTAVGDDLADNIQSGKAVGNKRVFTLLKTQKQKIQED